jgi:ubiquinone/menaquinone biosynthesis C-methylase UbiE/uncharacterized protein YbaR (Trm112 family)
METQAPYTQPKPFLDVLMEYLACPIENTAALAPVQNPEGTIVSLKSRNGLFPVISNVPRMMPKTGARGGRTPALWKKLQEKIWSDFKAGYSDFDFFSRNEDPLERAVGLMMDGIVRGALLDVGCGVTQLPGYMAVSDKETVWIGLDPYLGDEARWFPFVQGLAENLPFRPQSFDGVVFAGTLDHVIDPKLSLIRARSVIKPEGKLVVWNNLAPRSSRYIIWKVLRTLGLTARYDDYHQWQFSRRSLLGLLHATDFGIEEIIEIKPGDYLVVARCV